jgi:ER membrane protein complex subunit 8/9
MASESAQTSTSTAPDHGVVLEENAFLRIWLHALKFPLSGVNGVLVGTRVRSADGALKSTVVSRVAPMIHTNTSLPGQIEIAVALLGERLKELNKRKDQGAGELASADLEIVGYYQCNERREDVDLGPVARRIADGVGTLALVLDSEALGALLDGTRPKSSPFVVFNKSSCAKSTWVKAAPGTGLRIPFMSESGEWVERLRQAISEDFGGVHDFEEHMEDVRIDFLQ